MVAASTLRAMRTCPPLLCPVCTAAMSEVEQGYRCSSGHSYDRSRHGYVDLLPHGHGRSNRTGDSREMVAARQRFLDRGHYEPLRERLATVVTRELPTGQDAAILDSGCGDGYYLAGIRAAVPHACCSGFDISPWALRAAGRRCPGCTLFLNDVTHRICLPAASMDGVLNVFAPRNADEFARVLKPGALLIVVIPAPGHLSGVEELLSIGVAPDKLATTLETLGGIFRLEEHSDLSFDMTLEADAIEDLLGMTPGAWHVEADALRAAAVAAGTREVRAAFHVVTLRRGG
jgi:23S rRNA (guanine745-N1)-methyltransferase